ncbi:Uncharacterised protein [Nocardia otitidiscaviarum]|uniref:Uncharacterized protein n=1 Tax=Nocardia otitidiscaviarum TaxID=1823 RepID=A0A378YI95_9NOCA|nr:hypothetical protein [Nocardia otitidiscaviarum]SUA76463.1 Uncharacterised protein [Nocardia otitidiscaviarum]
MRIKTAVASLGIALAGAAAMATVGAASAAAVNPVIEPAQGVYFGLEFDPAETAALGNSAIPGLLTQFLPVERTGFVLDDDSVLPVVDGLLYATPGAVVNEAAARQGQVGIALVDPAVAGGYQFLIVQDLP